MTLQTTDLSVAPFFDDYDDAKNFQRILFRPRSVQARELNQAQTILQEQINRLGRHSFEEGSVVIPGGVNAKVNQDTVTIDFSGAITEAQMNEYMPNLYIKSKLGTIEAKVIHYNPAIGNDAPALAIEYTKSASDGTTKKFTNGEVCVFILRQEGGDVEISNVTVLSTHVGLYVSVLSGVYFVHGHFVLAQAQNILAEALDNTLDRSVGFSVAEDIIDELKDDSLYSNALGEPNYRAPGAARLRIKLILSVKKDSAPDPNFVELVRFSLGAIKRKVDQTDYAILERAMAQRTYETNGNYVVNGYPISIYQHLRDTVRPDGIYTAARGGDASKFIVRLGEGVGYVQGYRGFINGFEDIVVDKALDTAIINNGVMYAAFGAYIIVDTLNSLPPMDIKKRLNLMAADGSTIVGTCVVRSMKRESSTQVRLYIMDVVMGGSYTFTNDAKKVKFSDASNLFTANIVGSSLFNASQDSFVFPLPYSTVKSMVGSGGVDISYAVVRTYDVVVNASGIGSVTVPSGELFAAINSFDYVVAKTSSTGGAIFDAATTLSVGGSPTGRTLNINVTNANPSITVRVVASVLKSNPMPKVKTLLSNTETIVFTGETRKKLAKADIYALTSVMNLQTNIPDKDSFSFNDGQRPNWYENGEVYTKNGNTLTGSWTFTYQYFSHSNGDYFNVDSYGGMARELIPYTTSIASRDKISLADAIDFRPLKDSSGVFTSVTFAGDMVDPSDSLRFDLTYYLNRRDIVYQTPEGTYQVKKGVPGDTPAIPETPANCMKLFELFVPAYTTNVGNVIYNRTDNRRYTMRDIGKLESRIGTLEYYTSLSLLEQKINNSQIIDPVTGNNRFKNGFTADSFRNLSLSDVMDPQWDAIMAEVEGLLVPAMIQNPQDMSVSTSTSAKLGQLASKSYTETLYASQPLATTTTNINPYAVYAWVGTITLNPASDFWKDVIYIAPNIVRQPPAISWSWTKEGDITVPPAGTQFSDTGIGFMRQRQISQSVSESGFGSNALNITSKANTTWDIDRLQWMVTGSTTTKSDVVTSDYDSLISSSVVPYMRARDIGFTLEGFRPFTRLHFFFGGVNVDAFCRPTGGIAGDAVLTDAAGKATGFFAVPNTDANKFPVGTSVFRATDSATDARTGDDYTTSGEAKFSSGGVTETLQNNKTVQETTMTSNSEGWAVVRTDRFTVVDEWTRPNPDYMVPVVYLDPIAQTILISEEKGIFVSKIGIAFATKAAHVPVTLQIRSTIAGLPTNVTVPFGKCILYPSDIVTSEDGSVMTYFTFNDPVYLAGGKEYAIVLLADTQEYNVYKAVMGSTVIGTQTTVVKQPDAGVFLSSSNSSTWTPHQLEDMKFSVHKAQFNTSTDTVVEFNGSAPVITRSQFNPLSTVTGTNVVTARVRCHGLKTGDSVVISNFVDANGIPANQINGSHVISNPTIDTFQFTTTSNANVTGTMGGDAVRFLTNYPFTEFKAMVSQRVLQGTSIAWEYQYKLQGSRATSSWIPFVNSQEIVFMDAEGVVINAPTDFKVRCTMRTADANLTPQVDLAGMGFNMIGRRLNNDEAHPAYSYVTKSVRFDNPSTSAKVWVGVSLPGNSTMKVYYKPLVTPDEVLNTKPWTEIQPTVPLGNSNSFKEYEYNISGIGTFVGYKMRVIFLGDDPCQAPLMSDFRTVSLA